MTAAIPEPTREPNSPDGAVAPSGQDERFAHLSAGVRRIRSGVKRINPDERLLMIAGGILAPAGLVVVFIGWYGAAHSPYSFQQIPYLISGGLLGLGLVFLGGFLYFAHWVAESVKEQRRHTAEVVGAIGRLEAALGRVAGATSANGKANGVTAAPAPPVLVATARGTVAHRVECVVVAGKSGLRPVDPGEQLGACRLCDPYTVHDQPPLAGRG